MPREGCRDCKRCVESAPQGCWRGLTYLLIVPALLDWWAAFAGEKCPRCKHPLAWHRRRADGSFTD